MSVRRLLGMPISRRSMHQNQLVRLTKKSTMKSQSGGRHTVFYSIFGVDHQGNEILLGEGFKGESEAQAAMQLIAREFGLRLAPESRPSEQAEKLTIPAI